MWCAGGVGHPGGVTGRAGWWGQWEKQHSSLLEPGSCSNLQPTHCAHPRTPRVGREVSAGWYFARINVSLKGRQNRLGGDGEPAPSPPHKLLAQVWQWGQALLVGTELKTAKEASPPPCRPREIPFLNKKCNYPKKQKLYRRGRPLLRVEEVPTPGVPLA